MSNGKYVGGPVGGFGHIDPKILDRMAQARATGRREAEERAAIERQLLQQSQDKSLFICALIIGGLCVMITCLAWMVWR